MAFGLLLRVTHTGLAAESIHVSDVRDGIEVLGGAFGFRKAGPIYIPTPANGGVALLVYAGDVAVSFEVGGIRKFIENGYLTAVFEAGDSFEVLLPSVLDEGILLTSTPTSLDFVGAGVVATTVGDAVTITVVGGGGGGDHSTLSNLVWTASAHTGTASNLAAFDGGGAAAYISTTLSGDVAGTLPGPITVTDFTITGEAQGAVLYNDGSNWVTLAPGTSGQFLQTQGAGANPQWAAAGAGGDHAALSNLSWAVSAHVGTAGSFATFDGGGAAALLTGAVQGDITYFNGTIWTRLPPGTSGQVLQTQGAGANPQWAATGAGGDHATLSNITWTTSAHAGAAGSLATFSGAGAAAVLTGVAQGDVVYFDGTVFTRLAPGTSGQFLQTLGAGANPQWAAGGGGGDVVGPAGATDNAIARYDTATGKLLQDSGVLIDDSDNVTIPTGSTLAVDDIVESTLNNGVTVGGVRFYPASAADPAVGPAPADGDGYYNTTLDMEMRYDATRAKWLSVESTVFHFGRSGNVAAGSYYRGNASVTFSTTLGYTAFYDGTIVSLGYTRSDTDAATFEVTEGGVTRATLASSAVKGKDITLDGDFSADSVLGARNAAGGNTTSNVIGWIRVRWRA